MSHLDKDSSEYTNARENLVKRICDPVSKTVCCERRSRCVSADPQVHSFSPERSKSCDPANGSCLPEVEKCGIAGGEQRIVGGEDALPGEFPFTALLGKKKKRKVAGVVLDMYIYTCGGTLINLRYVVTAAHCHDPAEKRNQINLVRLGEYEVTDHRTRGGKTKVAR